MHGTTPHETPRETVVHVESLVQRAGTSFFWAMRLLPEEKRRAMYAIYAFCREVDDIADEPAALASKFERLRGWRREIDRLYGGRPERPVARALAAPIARYGLRREDFLAVIDGMEMDAAERVRVADMAGLALYCDRVACAVGRLSVRVFGIDSGNGDRLARALGEALQITNILRDLDEDADLDRLYLPADLLRRHGVAATDPKAALADAALPGACAELADLAARRFDEAAAVIAACDARAARPAVLMMEVYRRTFRRLRARGWRPPRRPVALSGLEKLWVVVRNGFA
jgi:phytoene synthase